MNKTAPLKRITAVCAALVMVTGFLFGGYAYAKDKRLNMTYIYFGTFQAFINNVDKTAGSLDTASPSYFDLDFNGNLVMNDIFDPAFVEAMAERDVRVVPFLSNHWDREKGRAALANRERLAEQVADAVREYGFDGVNIDIENLTEADREDYVDFVRLIREKLPRRKEVSVAVAANPKASNIGWHGSYDYEALARYSDYLMVMAYDEKSEGDEPGPVASTSFVEESIKYALQQVAADKIVLGIPFYGRYWKEGQSYGGYGIHLNKVEELLKNYNSRVEFDEYAGSPRATVNITINDGYVDVLGGRLSPGTYTIWYENEESIQQKLRLVQKYGLKGAGSWSLGQETAHTWDYFEEWLNGSWFVDTYRHWAQDQIADMEERSWMQGISSIHFAPDMALTRAQSAAILVRALELEGTRGSGHFNDVPTQHWANKEIGIVEKHGIMQGKGNGEFCPDDSLTREEMAVILERIIKEAKDRNYDYDREEVIFKDVDSERWSYEAISTMSSRGIFMGYDDGTFRPAEVITRAQMATLMSRIADDIE